MRNFQYYNPTKVVFGVGEFNKIGSETKNWGNKALLVKQKGPLEKMGVYQKAQKLLTDAGVGVVCLDGVSSNPKLSQVEEGVEIAKRDAVDVVVAVGGGSCIDAAKAIAIGAMDNGELWDFWARKRVVTQSLPVNRSVNDISHGI